MELQNGNGHSTPPLTLTPTPTSTPLSRSGNFVVLNKSTLSQMKAVKHIPAGKIKKMLFPLPPRVDSDGENPATAAATTTTTSTTTTVSKRIHSITLNNSVASSPLPSSSPAPSSQQPPPQQQLTPIHVNRTRPLSLDPSVRLTHFEGFKRLLPNQNQTKMITNNITISTNGRPKSPPKSGILIKRNHLKNFTTRKLNVVRSTSGNDDTKVDATINNNNNDNSNSNNNNNNNNNDRVIRRSVQFSINKNSKDGIKNHRTLKTLIADLEN